MFLKYHFPDCMLSQFEIKEKTLFTNNSKSFYDAAQLLHNKSQFIYLSNFYNMSIINISTRRLSFVLKGHNEIIYQISILQKENHSASIILSYDRLGFFKFWSNTNKKCLRTMNPVSPGYCFAYFGSRIIVYNYSTGLGIFNFNGKQVEAIKGDDEMNICYCMIIHRNATKNLLIYAGTSSNIIIRNVDENFEMISKIEKIGITYTMATFYNKHIPRLELIASNGYEVVYIELENFKEIKNFIECRTNIVYWRNFIIFGVSDVVFYQIKEEGIHPFFSIECDQEELKTITVYEENDGLNLVVTTTKCNVWLYRIKFSLN